MEDRLSDPRALQPVTVGRAGPRAAFGRAQAENGGQCVPLWQPRVHRGPQVTSSGLNHLAQHPAGVCISVRPCNADKLTLVMLPAACS